MSNRIVESLGSTAEFGGPVDGAMGMMALGGLAVGGLMPEGSTARSIALSVSGGLWAVLTLRMLRDEIS